MKFKWYEIAAGSSIEQGDIINECRVVKIPKEITASQINNGVVDAEWKIIDQAIILTQSCDLIAGKIDDILVCPLHSQSEMRQNASGMENIRKGLLTSCHLLNSCELAGFQRGPMIVSFRQIYSLPLFYVKDLAESHGNRLRLLPPYREHLSQAFARFFMRVGLPSDIPSFVKKS
jgi:hypothetical protein